LMINPASGKYFKVDSNEARTEDDDCIIVVCIVFGLKCDIYDDYDCVIMCDCKPIILMVRYF
jgi:broad-specificity NMP kinase